MYTEYLDLLKSMIRIPSTSFNEDEVAICICKFLQSKGICLELVQGNIVAANSRYDTGKKTLALIAHMDTVPANSGYTRDPHDPGNDSDIIWGLGANDDGGSVVAMTAAFCHFYNEDMPINLMLVISREEECSGPDGTKYLFASDGFFSKSEKYNYPEWAIVGEPTGMRAATSERGLLVIDGEAHGVSGHAGRGEGINALYIALDDIQALRNHVFSRHSPIMGDVRLNVTQIQAGRAHNVVPELCTFVVDIRPTEMYSNPEILQDLQAKCKSTLKARNLLNRSSATKAGSPLIATASRLGVETFSSPTTSDWMRISCDAVKMGPGDSSRSHKADEYIKHAEITQAIDKYIEFIENFYGNTLE